MGRQVGLGHHGEVNLSGGILLEGLIVTLNVKSDRRGESERERGTESFCVTFNVIFEWHEFRPSCEERIEC